MRWCRWRQRDRLPGGVGGDVVAVAPPLVVVARVLLPARVLLGTPVAPPLPLRPRHHVTHGAGAIERGTLGLPARAPQTPAARHMSMSAHCRHWPPPPPHAYAAACLSIYLMSRAHHAISPTFSATSMAAWLAALAACVAPAHRPPIPDPIPADASGTRETHTYTLHPTPYTLHAQRARFEGPPQEPYTHAAARRRTPPRPCAPRSARLPRLMHAALVLLTSLHALNTSKSPPP